jgi:hypothetical protein
MNNSLPSLLLSNGAGPESRGTQSHTGFRESRAQRDFAISLPESLLQRIQIRRNTPQYF